MDEIIVEVCQQLVIRVCPYEVVAALPQFRVPSRLACESLKALSNFIPSRIVHDCHCMRATDTYILSTVAIRRLHSLTGRHVSEQETLDA